MTDDELNESLIYRVAEAIHDEVHDGELKLRSGSTQSVFLLAARIALDVIYEGDLAKTEKRA